MDGVTVVLASTDGVTVKVLMVELKLRVQAPVTAPVVYTEETHEPAGHVPPTVELLVYPVLAVTVTARVAPWFTDWVVEGFKLVLPSVVKLTA